MDFGFNCEKENYKMFRKTLQEKNLQDLELAKSAQT